MLWHTKGACRLIGKAAYLLEEYAQAGMAYRKATELNVEAQPAWKGLVELYTSTQEAEKLVDALENLVTMMTQHHPNSVHCQYKFALMIRDRRIFAI